MFSWVFFMEEAMAHTAMGAISTFIFPINIIPGLVTLCIYFLVRDIGEGNTPNNFTVLFFLYVILVLSTLSHSLKMVSDTKPDFFLSKMMIFFSTADTGLFRVLN